MLVQFWLRWYPPGMDTRLQVVKTGEIDTGKRYTDQDRDGAYLLWRTTAGRSCRKVAHRLGINERTIYNWRDSHGWIDKANHEDQDDYASSRIGVAAIVVNELVPSIEEAVRIRDHGTDDKVRLAAAQWLAGLAGVSPVSKIETAITDNRTQVIEAAPDFANMSVEQLREYELAVKRKR